MCPKSLLRSVPGAPVLSAVRKQCLEFIEFGYYPLLPLHDLHNPVEFYFSDGESDQTTPWHDAWDYAVTDAKGRVLWLPVALREVLKALSDTEFSDAIGRIPRHSSDPLDAEETLRALRTHTSAGLSTLEQSAAEIEIAFAALDDLPLQPDAHGAAMALGRIAREFQLDRQALISTAAVATGTLDWSGQTPEGPSIRYLLASILSHFISPSGDRVGRPEGKARKSLLLHSCDNSAWLPLATQLSKPELDQMLCIAELIADGLLPRDAKAIRRDHVSVYDYDLMKLTTGAHGPIHGKDATRADILRFAARTRRLCAGKPRHQALRLVEAANARLSALGLRPRIGDEGLQIG